MDAPENVLVADLQNGCQVFVKWTAPAGAPQGYNVYRCSTLAGTYIKENLEALTDTKYVIGNLNLGQTVYVKASAIDETGAETVLSAVGQDAIITLPTVTLQVEAVQGDSIAAGSYFAAHVGSGVVVFQVLTDFGLTGEATLWELDENNYVEFMTDHIVVVLGGVTVAEIWDAGIFIKGRKAVLDDLGVCALEAPDVFEWDASVSTLFFVHTGIRLLGIDTSGNLFMPQHDAQPFQMGGTSSWGVIESGNELIFANGYYQMIIIDRDQQQLLVRGRIAEETAFT